MNSTSKHFTDHSIDSILKKQYKKRIKFACTKCRGQNLNIQFSNVKKLKEHKLTFHKNNPSSHLLRNHKCTICKNSFPSKISLNRHIKKIHEAALPKPQCNICNESFISKGKMEKHKRIYHENKPPYWCKECDIGFIFKNTLNYHIIHLHIDKKKKIFSCKICNESFENIASLRKHHISIHFEK